MKNYADLYNLVGDSSSVVKGIYLKAETTRGQLIAPGSSDFMYVLGGGSIEFAQPYEISPHVTGDRHNNNIIRKKKETSWSFTSYFNINEALGSFAATEIDLAFRTLWKSLLGKEVVGVSALTYTATQPDITFSIYEVGDRWARQVPGAFVQGGNIQLPGNGEATIEWTGDGKTSFNAGIGKSLADNEGGNEIELEAGEGELFDIGALVMLVKDDGTTRSTDTPSGSARTVTDIQGDVITVSGAPLTDADGTTNPIYLVYYEPASSTAIDNPVTGLVGSMSVAGLNHDCFRNFGLNIQNNHEKVDYCFGCDSLCGSLFVAASKVNMEVTLEMNLNKETSKLFKRAKNFEAQALDIKLGDDTGRHVQFLLPRVIFNVPAFAVPESGSIPVSYTGTALQTALGAGDELTVNFK